jgi:hypothetical protein
VVVVEEMEWKRFFGGGSPWKSGRRIEKMGVFLPFPLFPRSPVFHGSRVSWNNFLLSRFSKGVGGAKKAAPWKGSGLRS